MNQGYLRIHHLEPASRVNGPGVRAVIWLQGCSLGCPGCFNPETHTIHGGQAYPVKKLAAWLRAEAGRINGLTISGGEPLQELFPLRAFLEQIQVELTLPVILFTGYAWDEIRKMPESESLLKLLDVVIAGRFILDQRIANHMIGSTNKTVHFLTSAYQAADFESIPSAEVIIGPVGDVRLSGIDPLNW